MTLHSDSETSGGTKKIVTKKKVQYSTFKICKVLPMAFEDYHNYP